MTTPSTDLKAVGPPSQLARIVALSTLQTTATDLSDLDPILAEALSDATLDQAAVLLRRVEATQRGLATAAEMVNRRLTVLTGTNGIFPISGGLVVERTGGKSSSKRKAWDRERLLPLAAKKAAEQAWAGVGGTLPGAPPAVEAAATLALRCVASDWRLPGLRALGLDPERYSDEAAPSRTTFTIRPADLEETTE